LPTTSTRAPGRRIDRTHREGHGGGRDRTDAEDCEILLIRLGHDLRRHRLAALQFSILYGKGKHLDALVVRKDVEAGDDGAGVADTKALAAGGAALHQEDGLRSFLTKGGGGEGGGAGSKRRQRGKRLLGRRGGRPLFHLHGVHGVLQADGGNTSAARLRVAGSARSNPEATATQ
jgi:hypothetical protein